MDKTVDNLERLRRGDPSLILGESIQSLGYRFDVILSKKLPNKFLCIALSQGILYLTKDRLTPFPFFDLFGHQREGGEKLNEYLDNHLGHSNRRRDLGIDVEAV